MSAATPLLAQHAALIRASGISEAVVAERGYRSVTRPGELGRLGFRDTQRNVPALLSPIWDVTRSVGLYQTRPDTPRIGANGKPVKYETPGKARMCLDIPPRVHRHLDDPRRRLYITEGVRKADSAASQDLACIDVLGVWNWRGTNDAGGKVALADWDAIALNGREVLIAFDSDVMAKGSVYQALARFKGFLEQRGARVGLVYLPAGANGAKVGLDDFLAAGHTEDDLLALAADSLRPAPADDDALPYKALSNGGFVWLKPTRDGAVETPLTNFQARIVGDVAEDDGVEQRRALDLVTLLHGKTRRLQLPAERFAAMNWPIEHLGAGALVYPGMGTKDHARAAIQVLSGAVAERTVYTHTGWRQHDDQAIYLHAGGAIGAQGTVPGVEVALAGDLGRYALPTPPDGDALAAAIRASLHALTIAPLAVTIPVLAAVYRAPLGGVDFALWLAGPTGAGKSELAALAQQHYGPGLDARHLPGSWTSTGNALEGLAFTLKDTLFTIDDFAPSGNATDVQRLHRDAERVLRAQGNQAGRQRMNANTSLRPAKPPRGLVLGTGEDIPRGQSARARALVLELGPGDLQWARLARCQADAASGLYAQALAGYLRRLAGDLAGYQAWLRGEVARLRALAVTSTAHRRTPGIVAELAAGWRCFLDYAVEAGTLGAAEAQRAWERAWRELGRAAATQARHQVAQEPARRFLELLGSAIANGGAHVAAIGGAEPDAPEHWGWRSSTIGGDFPRTEWRPQGTRVGWVSEETLYLDRDSALAVVQRLGRDTGDPPAITGQVLAKRLHERGYLASTDEARGTLSIRRTLDGQQRAVLHLHALALSTATETDISDIPSRAAPPMSENRDGTVSFSSVVTPETDTEKPRHDEQNEANVGNVGFSPAGEGRASETPASTVGLFGPAAPSVQET